ncbi:MAG: 30S ribosomal protein S15 [Phycisphaerales bacterium]
MVLATAIKKQVIKDYQRSETDSGSSEVQIALLTSRINELTEHLKTHKADHHCRRGLVLMVGRRNRLLRYLHRTERTKYLEIIGRLGLRK